MPSFDARQHIFSSVERGYFPQQGRGFQTVAMDQGLTGTEDLRVLEKAFYTISAERRDADDYPIKETFCRLPSGDFAVGRTVNWRSDSTGRAGNYLAHHLVLKSDALLAAGGDPFPILDVAGLAEPDLDLTPCALPLLHLNVPPTETDYQLLAKLPADLIANLAIAVIDGTEKTLLLIGVETQTRQVIQGLFAVLAVEERLRLTFSTHFYESHHLRPLFALVTVGSRVEAPASRQDYIEFDMTSGEFAAISPHCAYAKWLAESVRQKRWKEIAAVNSTLNRLRGHPGSEGGPLPPSQAGMAALWERAGTGMSPVLVGNARLIIACLNAIPTPKTLADALLASPSPPELCGENATEEESNACLSLLCEKATPTVWRNWIKQWENEPLLAPFTQAVKPWWKRLRRQKES